MDRAASCSSLTCLTTSSPSRPACCSSRSCIPQRSPWLHIRLAATFFLRWQQHRRRAARTTRHPEPLLRTRGACQILFARKPRLDHIPGKDVDICPGLRCGAPLWQLAQKQGRGEG
ncbi:hypothetical protein IG631_07119 [Alternaria alternata]|nr:hypothetical protein IG631_07119 [Alternaria alternata]